MPPNVFFASSCSLGRIDLEKDSWDNTKETSFTFNMLEKGSAVYFAATRTTWGQVGEIPDSPAYSYEDQGIGGAQGLGYLLYNYMITENCTTGEALMKAKNEFIDNSGNFFGLLDSLRFEIMWEYQLYGDPAFNPYEPCNEGTNYGS